MDRDERKGKRRKRSEISKVRVPMLGYYFIVTDAKETEQNYFFGLRNSIPKSLQGKLVIKVIKAKSTNDLVNEALNLVSLNPQYGEPWIIFDRDRVPNFDDIIQKAKNAGINVGWTNPCIETWFSTYFGKMLNSQDSVACCRGFSELYQKIVKQEYSKSDDKIYEKLNRFGNETTAISIAGKRFNEYVRNEVDKPSDMCPCTTVHNLVDEIKSKVMEDNT